MLDLVSQYEEVPYLVVVVLLPMDVPAWLVLVPWSIRGGVDGGDPAFASGPLAIRYTAVGEPVECRHGAHAIGTRYLV